MTGLPDRAAFYLGELTIHSDRHVGGEGNKAATELFARASSEAGLSVTRQTFSCLEWTYASAYADAGDERFDLHVGPYSPAASIKAPLRAVSTIGQLESEHVRGAIVLLHGDIASHQLMPKNFPFYNPESHQRVYSALDRQAPVAVIAATGLDPEMVGSQYPYPLFEDGDLTVPSAYLKDVDGERLLAHAGETVELLIESQRIPARAEQIVAVKAGRGQGRIVVSAHIDSRKDSPGALDNASGVAVLLCLAELLTDYEGAATVELVPFNGEDYYAAPGQKEWLKANDGRLGDIIFGINIDDAGLRNWDTHVSFYGVSERLKSVALKTAHSRDGFEEGPEWFQGDHAILAMRGVPVMAIASAGMYEFMTRYAHSKRDTVDLADYDKIADIALYVRDVIERVATTSMDAEHARKSG